MTVQKSFKRLVRARMAKTGWLRDIELSERTVSKPKIARFDVGDGTSRLFVSVDAKGPVKSTVVVEQSKLVDAAEREARKTYWRHALATLQAELERDASPVSGRSR